MKDDFLSLNCIVTGATGFIGAALVNKILLMGSKVTAVVRDKSNPRLPRHPNLTVIEGSLEEISEWKFMLDYQPDVFYHLAWNGVKNLDRNEQFQIENISASIDTIHLAKKLGCKRWIGTGSQAEYGPLNCCISENSPVNPTTLYGVSKLATGLLSEVTGTNLEIQTVWVRVFSTYGPGDNQGWMLTDLIRQLHSELSPKLTKGEQLWDYLYIDDAVDALVTVGTHPKASGIYNLGSGKCQTIRSIVETVKRLMGSKVLLRFGEIPYRSDQVMHLEADVKKLRQDTGWYPKVDLEDGLSNTINYIIRASSSS